MKRKKFIFLIILYFSPSSVYPLHALIKNSRKVKFPNHHISDTLSVDMFGAVGDGATDDTRSFQSCIQYAVDNKISKIELTSRKSYRITSPILLCSNISIDGCGASISYEKKGDLRDNNNSFFTCISKKRISIKNINFISNSGQIYALKVISSSDIQILGCKSKGASLIHCMTKAESTYKSIKSYDFCNNISVLRCEAIGLEDFVDDGCIVFSYSQNFRVSQSIIRYYNQGIMWWGGDSNHQRDGQLSNERKCKNGLIENNVISYIKGGGIWGSMGKNIDIISNNVSNCNDVGIDSEGSSNILIKNNKVHNCNNGCITTFFLNINVQVVDNSVSTNIDKQFLFKIYNSSQSFDNKSISLKGNIFKYTGSYGMAFLGGDNVENLEVINNSFENVVLELSSNNNHIINIMNNSFQFTRNTMTESFINVGNNMRNGLLNIVGNSFTLKSVDLSNNPIFCIRQSDFNTSPITIISGNSFENFCQLLVFKNYSKNSSVMPSLLVENNIISSSEKQMDFLGFEDFFSSCTLFLDKEKVKLSWFQNQNRYGKDVLCKIQ
jgi:Right handed beta helix region